MVVLKPNSRHLEVHEGLFHASSRESVTTAAICSPELKHEHSDLPRIPIFNFKVSVLTPPQKVFKKSMNIDLTTIFITGYGNMAYVYDNQHFASLRALPARTKLYAGGREVLFAKPLVLIFTFILLFIAPQPVLAQSESTADQVDSLDTIEEGFSGSTNSDIDYEALVKELYGEDPKQATAPEPEVVTEPIRSRKKDMGPAPGLLKNSFLHGAHLAVNAASPFAVSDPLFSWYSFIDGSVTFKLPYEVYVESIPLYILFEVSSFSFTNSYPEGGTFEGISYILQGSTIGDHAGAVVGFGLWSRSMGSMLELNYRFRPTKNTFFRLGTRGVLISDIDPVGNAWWLELRLSTGLEL
ncbi:MAG: hypothetical protein U9Q77_11650 [Candidatus Marinimicrobia bacterium]|nr:hypothetical protein [Candidatus Neomarinimicrobiota bacterium]